MVISARRKSGAGAHVRLVGLGKAFDDEVVLRGVDLTVERGELVGVIGPSGCGKTTLLKLVAGLVAPTEGRVEFSGGPSRRRESLSFVFQEATLLPWLNVLDNVALPLRLAGATRQEREAKALTHIERVGLADATRLYPRQLSGGMKMRVSVARAMTVDPTLLLLDEPFGALDEMTRDTLNEELLRLRQAAQWTALFVTHSVAEAVFLASRVIVLGHRPSAIAQTIEVPLGYPRSSMTRERSEYVERVVMVTRALHSVDKKR